MHLLVDILLILLIQKSNHFQKYFVFSAPLFIHHCGFYLCLQFSLYNRGIYFRTVSLSLNFICLL